MPAVSRAMRARGWQLVGSWHQQAHADDRQPVIEQGRGGAWLRPHLTLGMCIAGCLQGWRDFDLQVGWLHTCRWSPAWPPACREPA